jgi:hypothetical protein
MSSHLAAIHEALEAGEDGDGAFDRWTLATGTLLDLRDITGLMCTPDPGLVLQNLRTLPVDPDGDVHRLWIGITREPGEVLDELRSMRSGL